MTSTTKPEVSPRLAPLGVLLPSLLRLISPQTRPKDLPKPYLQREIFTKFINFLKIQVLVGARARINYFSANCSLPELRTSVVGVISRGEFTGVRESWVPDFGIGRLGHFWSISTD